MKIYALCGRSSGLARSADEFVISKDVVVPLLQGSGAEGLNIEAVRVSTVRQIVFSERLTGSGDMFAHEMWREIAIRRFMGWPIPAPPPYQPITLDELSDWDDADSLDRLIQATEALYGEEYAVRQAKALCLE